MSLQIAAKHLAAKGRGPDTTLVHMTNKEVQGLQALAEKNGGSLSINPDTGLPEAGFLESILPVVAGVGLTAAGMGPMAAALTVGGVSALSTGSLSKGLFAGLGAYGGASLGEQLAVQGMGEAAAANASFGDKLAGMGDASAFSSFENAGKFISANKLPAMAGIAGPLLSSMEDEKENDKPSEPVKDTDPGARARSGIKFNPGYLTPTPLPNPYGIEQTYATPYYAAEGGVTHMAEGGMAYGGSTSIDTKSQFADYLNKVMNPTNRTNAISGSTNPYDWWKSQSRPEVPPPAPAETAEEYRARMSANARGGDGGGGRGGDEGPPGEGFSPTSESAYNVSRFGQQLGYVSPIAGGLIGAYGDYLAKNVNPNYSNEGRNYPAPAPAFGMSLSDNDDSVGRTPTDFGYSLSDNNDSVGRGDFSPSPSELAGTSALDSSYANYSPSELAGTAARSSHSAFPAEGTLFEPFGRNPAHWDDTPVTDTDTDTDTAPDPYAFGMSLSDNNDSVGRGDFASGFGISPSDNNDSVGRGDFSPSPSELAGALALDAAPFGAFDFGPTAGALEAEKAAQTAAQKDRIESLLGVDPYAKFDNFNFDKTALAAKAEQDAATQAQQDRIRSLAEAPASLMPARDLMFTDVDTFAPVAYSAADEADRMFAAPDLTPSVPGAISADPDADTDKKAQELEIPSVAEFAAMLGPSLAQTAALNTGIVSDIAPQGLAGVGGFGSFNAFGYSPSDNNDSVGRSDFGGDFGLSPSDNNDSVGRSDFGGDFGLSPSDNNDSVGRGDFGGDFGYSVSDNNDSVGRGDSDGGGGYGGAAADGGGRDSDGSPYARGGEVYGGLPNPYNLGSYSDGGRLLKGPGDGVSDSIPATIGKGRPARLADGEFVIPARIVSEIGNGSTEAGARKLYAMMDRIQAGRKKSVGKGKVAVNSRADKYLPA